MRVRHIQLAGTFAVMMVLAGSALLKFSDLPAFLRALSSWRIVPGWSQGTVSVLVPSAELLLAGLWLSGSRYGRATRMAAIALLLVWTVGYVIETLIWGPPQCGCFGKIRDWFALRAEAPWTITRNVVLGLVLVFGADPAPRTSSTTGVRQDRPAGAVAGFTLIETILVISLTGLLITLILPSLSAVKRRAKSIETLSDLRTHAAIATAYGNDFKDSFVCTLDPRYTHTVVDVPGIARRELVAYFSQRWYWRLGLADGYYGGNPSSPIFFAPNRDGPGRTWTYNYTVAGLARPEYWNPETRKPTGQIGPMHLAEVLYPTRKAIFANMNGISARNRILRQYGQVESSFCDGSARVVKDDSILPSAPGGEGPLGWPYSTDDIGDSFIHTLDGVRGADTRN